MYVDTYFTNAAPPCSSPTITKIAIELCLFLNAKEILTPQKEKNNRKQNVVEIGSGAGLAAIYAASCGANVLATDGNIEVLDLLMKNVKENSQVTQTGGNVKTTQWMWGNEKQFETICEKMPQVDLLMGSDVIFEVKENSLFDLKKVLLQCKNAFPKMQIILSYNSRDLQR